MDLKQYRPTTIVQAVQIAAIDDTIHYSVVDANGAPNTIAMADVPIRRGPPGGAVAGDWLVLFETSHHDGGQHWECWDRELFDSSWMELTKEPRLL